MRFSKAAVHNLFYGGSLFFLLVFAGLAAHSIVYIQQVSTDAAALSPTVVAGKAVWGENSCVNCHTILGEGAYFAPEVGNVWARFGGKDDPQGARDYIVTWIALQPTGVEGRRQMPHFALDDAQLQAFADFLEWTSRTRTPELAAEQCRMRGRTHHVISIVEAGASFLRGCALAARRHRVLFKFSG